MVYSESDLKKAVEAVRLMVLADRDRLPQAHMVLDNIESDSPDEFYQRVLEFSRSNLNPTPNKEPTP